MKKVIISFFSICICMTMMLYVHPTYASSNSVKGVARGVYMSSATAYAMIDGEDDIIGRAVVTCLAQVKEIEVDMYLQRAYGNVWQNVSAACHMSVQDVAQLDKSAIIRNVTPGTCRIYIEASAVGYDGLRDTMAVGTGALVINT